MPSIADLSNAIAALRLLDGTKITPQDKINFASTEANLTAELERLQARERELADEVVKTTKAERIAKAQPAAKRAAKSTKRATPTKRTGAT